MERKIEFTSQTSKLCVSIMEKSEEDILKKLDNLREIKHDLIEIRVDYYEALFDEKSLEGLLKNIRERSEKPILFTLRTFEEGGKLKISLEDYLRINKFAIASKLIDLIDLEYERFGQLENLLDLARESDIQVIGSYHDFKISMDEDKLVEKLLKMEKSKCDLVKIAVKTESERDLLAGLSASLYMKENGKKPFVVINMGRLGKIGRLSSFIFGSSIIYSSFQAESGLGQLEIQDLNEMLEILDR